MDVRVLDEVDFLRTAGLGASSVVVDLRSGTGSSHWQSSQLVGVLSLLIIHA
jgi:hypothetical protein